VELARIIGRTTGSVAMRLNNFAHIDPYHQQRGIVGLSRGKKQVEPIWNEFANNKEELLFESETALADLQQQTVTEKFKTILNGLDGLKGEEKVREIKTRINQNVFRQIVLSNYSNTCAISGIDIPELLIASHILPWSQYEKRD
jgi:putative restriction endonuclease